MIPGTEFENRLSNICRKHNLDSKKVLDFVYKITNKAQIEYAIIPYELPSSFNDIFEIFIITETLLYDIEYKRNNQMTYIVTPFRSIVNISHQIRSSGLFEKSGNFDQIEIQLLSGKRFYLVNHRNYSEETNAFASKINMKMGAL